MKTPKYITQEIDRYPYLCKARINLRMEGELDSTTSRRAHDVDKTSSTYKFINFLMHGSDETLTVLEGHINEACTHLHSKNR